MFKLLTKSSPLNRLALNYSITRQLNSSTIFLKSPQHQLHPSIDEHLKTDATLKKNPAVNSLDAFTVNSIFSRGILDVAKFNFVATEAKKLRAERKAYYAIKLFWLVMYIIFVDVIFNLKIRDNIKKYFQSLVDTESYGDQKRKNTKKSGTSEGTQTEKASPPTQPKPEKVVHVDSRGQEIKSKYFVQDTKVKFSDVRGIGDEKQELTDVVDFMRNPEKYNSLGAKLPKGILLSGPPGVGKTLLAKAVANEAGVPFFHIDGSSVEGPWVGTGVRKLEEIFTAAKQHSPSIGKCVNYSFKRDFWVLVLFELFLEFFLTFLAFLAFFSVFSAFFSASDPIISSTIRFQIPSFSHFPIVFIDEIDAIGGKRTTSDKYPHARSTINTLLSLMDGFDKDDPVVVLGSTNMPETLDEALLRSGRFDVKIAIPKPLRHQREQILQFYLGKLQTTVDINVDELARITGGMVPADMKNLANTAGRIAVAKGNLAVTQVDLVEAKDQMSMGVGRRSELRHLSKVTTENTAWHEAGHAVCMYGSLWKTANRKAGG